MPDETLPATGFVRSRRLGDVSLDAVARALARHELGELIEALPAPGGLFGQNLFVHATSGWHVLRGAPHFPWQFAKERHAVDVLHHRVHAPVPWPYRVDPSPDLFGWPFAWMPRLPGAHPFEAASTPSELKEIARAIGANLAALHAPTWPAAGEYVPEEDRVVAFPGGAGAWLARDIERWLAAAAMRPEATPPGDGDWVRRIVDTACPHLDPPGGASFTMNDYNPGNLLVERVDAGWRVSGVFDFMEFHVGDPDLDLVRMAVAMCDRFPDLGPKMVGEFVGAYRAERPAGPALRDRMACHIVRDRLIVWEYGTRPGVGWFDGQGTLRRYAETWLERLMPLLGTS